MRFKRFLLQLIHHLCRWFNTKLWTRWVFSVFGAAGAEMSLCWRLRTGLSHLKTRPKLRLLCMPALMRTVLCLSGAFLHAVASSKCFCLWDGAFEVRRWAAGVIKARLKHTAVRVKGEPGGPSCDCAECGRAKQGVALWRRSPSASAAPGGTEEAPLSCTCWSSSEQVGVWCWEKEKNSK